MLEAAARRRRRVTPARGHATIEARHRLASCTHTQCWHALPSAWGLLPKSASFAAAVGTRPTGVGRRRRHAAAADDDAVPSTRAHSIEDFEMVFQVPVAAQLGIDSPVQNAFRTSAAREEGHERPCVRTKHATLAGPTNETFRNA